MLREYSPGEANALSQLQLVGDAGLERRFACPHSLRGMGAVTFVILIARSLWFSLLRRGETVRQIVRVLAVEISREIRHCPPNG